MSRHIYTDNELRQAPLCIGCGVPKDNSLVVCWSCWSHDDLPFPPLKYWDDTTESWQRKLEDCGVPEYLKTTHTMSDLILKNRTGQTLRIFARPDDPAPCIELPPEGHKAALMLDRHTLALVHGVPIHNVRIAGTESLPCPADNVLVIVPPDVRNACDDRDDLLSPGPALVQQGVIVGHLGLDRRPMDISR